VSLRSFVAVEVGPRPALARLRDEAAALDRDLKAVAPENLHVTLRFLGDVDASEVLAILEALREACAGVAPFTMRLRGVGAFPSPARARVLWAGLEGADPLARVADGLSRRLGAPDKPFAAHVTLARAKTPKGAAKVPAFVARHRDWQGDEVPVERIVLMRSELAREGPTYTPLGAAALEA